MTRTQSHCVGNGQLQPPLYTPDEYNSHDVLKMSGLLWVVTLFLCRHVLTLVFGAFSIYMGSRRGVDTSGIHALFSEPVFVLASLPAILLVIVHFRRLPGAGPLSRWLWSKGRYLLVMSSVADLILLVLHVALGVMSVSEWLIANVFLDLYVIVYLVRSARARDTFAEFPPAQGAQPGN